MTRSRIETRLGILQFTVWDVLVARNIKDLLWNNHRICRASTWIRTLLIQNSWRFFHFKPTFVSDRRKMLLFCTLPFLLWGIQAAPIPWELVDMTYTFDETTLHWPTQKKFELKVTLNETTEEGYWLQLDEYFSGIHVGTHMDAPCHFSLGKWCVDEIPIERLAGPAAVVDITDKAEVDADAMVDINDLKEWEDMSGRSLNGTIVVIRSGWGRRWNNRTAFIGTSDNDTNKLHFPGMSPEAAQWLVDNRDIYGLITESLSLDAGKSKDFMTHRIILGANIYGLENVANVEEIPIVGAFIHVMPMKIGKGSGAPTRIIAKYPKVIFKQKDSKTVTERSLKEVIIFSK